MGHDRLVAITCIRNEDDIVEAFVRHTLAFADRLLVVDHGSADRTAEILAALADEGLAIEVLRDDRVGNLQSEQMTMLMHRAAELGATWVLPIDSDEFLQVTGGGPLSLPETDAPIVLAWTTYVPMRDDAADERNPVLRITHRLREEPHRHPKVFIPGELAGRSGAVLTQGNHGVMLDGRPVAATPFAGASLAHFPIRDVVQHAEKTATRWMQRSARGGTGAEDFFYEVKLENQLGADWEAFGESFWGAVPSYLAHEDHIERIVDPIDYRGGPVQHVAPPRSLGPVLGRTLQLADRIIRSARNEPDREIVDVTVHVRACRAGAVVEAGTGRATPEQPMVVRGEVEAGPIDEVEISVDAPGALIDVRAVHAGDWSWTTGLGPHPEVRVLDGHGALLPHLQCVRVVQPLPGARIRMVLPPGVQGTDLRAEVVVMQSAGSVARTVLDRAHVWALNTQADEEPPELRAMRVDMFAIRYEHDALVAARDEFRQERDQLFVDLQASQAHVREIGAALDEMRVSRDGWHAEAAAQRGELDAIRATAVWRARTRVVGSPLARAARRGLRVVLRR